MKQEALLHLIFKIFETSLLRKELPYDWRTANISAILKMAINQNTVKLTCIICNLKEKVYHFGQQYLK